jgi:hypothetical protein
MKLTKAKLIGITAKKLNELGYIELQDTLTGSNGLFGKKIQKDFFLTLGLEISRYYHSMFTASFYLSKTTRWGSVWGDIPHECYERVGHFLTPEERKKYLSEEFHQEGVIDAWWDGANEKEVANFIKIVKISEERFVGQKDLSHKIESSTEIKELSESAAIVIDKATTNNFNGRSYQFLPTKVIDDIPINWFRAAEEVLSQRKPILNANTVKLLAADAWHQKKIQEVNQIH